MIHARVDVELRDHEKAHAAGAAMATWTWALLWSRAKERDGFVARDSLRGAWVGERQAVKDFGKLVAVGLVSVVEGGWLLANYAPKNELKVEIDARRKAEADRKAAWRSRGNSLNSHRVPVGHTRDAEHCPAGTPASVPARVPAGVPRSESESESESDLNPLPPAGVVPGPVIAAPVAQATHDGAFGMSAGAWVAGVRAVTKGAVTRLDLRQTRALLALCDAHGGGRRGQDLLDWVTSTATEFARSVDANFGGFTPTRCATWLDAGKPTERAKGTPKIAQRSETKSFETANDDDVLEAARRGAELLAGGSR